jgi:hypothetical protein
MATSGTHDFSLDIVDIIEEAYERIGKEAYSGYDYRTARRSINLLMLEWQNRGLNLWKVKDAEQALTSGVQAYDLSPERVDVIEGVLRTSSGDTTNQTDLSMKRVSVSTWAKQTNKLQSGRPIQYWIEQTPSKVTVNVWPVPDGLESYVFHYYYMELIQDVGNVGSNTMDIPSRFLPSLISGLAYYLALKTPDVAAAAPGLKAVYDEQFQLASEAAREKASVLLVPEVYS